MVIRRGGRQDVRFLRDMLHHAYYWRERNPADGPGPAARYIKGWGRPGDTVLIAGKGHEKTQVIGDRELPFDDVLVSQAALARRRQVHTRAT